MKRIKDFYMIKLLGDIVIILVTTFAMMMFLFVGFINDIYFWLVGATYVLLAILSRLVWKKVNFDIYDLLRSYIAIMSDIFIAIWLFVLIMTRIFQ